MLREILAMSAAFGFLIFFPKGKLWNGVSLLFTGLIMGLCAGQAPSSIAENFTGIVTSLPTIKTIAVILQIGVLSALMKQYDILGRLVEAFKDVFSSAKAVIMILPAAIGMISVPGGAGISSPFVDELGDSLRLPVFKRAALNLTFRHCAFFLLPTSSSMIVLSNMAPHVSLYKLIALNVVFVAGMELTSYLLYLRGAEAPRVSRSSGRHKVRGLIDILKYMSPIYIIVLLNGLFKVPMYLSAFASLALILAGWGRHDVKTYVRAFRQGLSAQTFVMMLGIYFIQNTVRDLTGIMTAFQTIFVQSSGLGVLLVIAAAALLFGLTTGLSYVPLGILVPLLTGLHLPPAEELLYCVFIYTWSFIGYFFSPLHLCQALTLQQMNCSVSELNKGYLPLMIEMAVTPFAIFSLYRAILL